MQNVLRYAQYFILALVLVFGFSLVPLAQAKTFSTAAPLSGYAWSSNVGWISLNCANDSSCGTSNYSVQVNPSGTLTGYAWSSNVGWIQFGGLSGCPAGSCPATMNLTTSQATGWARALAYGNGWDGWISLNCSNTSGCATSAYTVAVDNTGTFTSSSYAWGSDVVGWVSFSLASVNTANICAPAPTTTCTADFSGVISTNLWCQNSTNACPASQQCYGTPASCGNLAAILKGQATLTVTPELVRKNSTVNVSWTFNAAQIQSCSVTTNDASPAITVSNTNSAALTYNNTVFTLSCIPLGGGPNTALASTTVRLLPTVYEN